MSRSWELFLGDMLEAARKVIRYSGDRQQEAFMTDEMAYDATALDNDTLWKIVRTDIPQLLGLLERIKRKLPRPS